MSNQLKINVIGVDYACLENQLLQYMLQMPIPKSLVIPSSVNWYTGYAIKDQRTLKSIIKKKNFSLLVPTGWLFMMTTEFDYHTEESTLTLSKVWFETKSQKNQFYHLLLHFGADPITIKGFNK